MKGMIREEKSRLIKGRVIMDREVVLYLRGLNNSMLMGMLIGDSCLPLTRVMQYSTEKRIMIRSIKRKLIFNQWYAYI